ncbi:MAG: hypothetical protein H6730_04920 [Deltaproteobacteria bacterium]|nr:hypothetical protein [Deltaproteobacteria bacterium]
MALLALTLVTACSGEEGPVASTPDAGGTSAGFCEPPLQLCGDRCVSTQNDPNHCGACFNTCPASSFCDRSSCATICSPGLAECGAACADLMTDRAHCGECNHACPGDRMCIDGDCVCPDGTEACGTACVDVTKTAAHCGACNQPCDFDELCSDAQCVCRTGTRETNCTDGVDDDCDDLVDCMDPDCDGATRRCMGACGVGIETCMGTTWGACEGGSGEAEICGDGVDQDCDGADLRNPDGWEPNDDCSQCRLVQPEPDPDLRISARFDSVDDQVDCFRFVADDSAYYREYIELRLTDIPAGNDYDLYLYESQSKCQARDALAVSDAAGNASESISYGESFGTSDSGTYFIRVVRYSGWSCDEDYALVINGLD